MTGTTRHGAMSGENRTMHAWGSRRRIVEASARWSSVVSEGGHQPEVDESGLGPDGRYHRNLMIRRARSAPGSSVYFSSTNRRTTRPERPSASSTRYRPSTVSRVISRAGSFPSRENRTCATTRLSAPKRGRAHRFSTGTSSRPARSLPVSVIDVDRPHRRPNAPSVPRTTRRLPAQASPGTRRPSCVLRLGVVITPAIL